MYYGSWENSILIISLDMATWSILFYFEPTRYLVGGGITGLLSPIQLFQIEIGERAIKGRGKGFKMGTLGLP